MPSLMMTIHGGKAKNDQMDAHKMAAILRGRMLPQASGSLAEMRATRDLLRRRLYLMRISPELLTQIQNPNSQYSLPEICLLLPPGQMCQAIGRHTLWDLGHEHRQCLPQVGLL